MWNQGVSLVGFLDSLKKPLFSGVKLGYIPKPNIITYDSWFDDELNLKYNKILRLKGTLWVQLIRVGTNIL